MEVVMDEQAMTTIYEAPALVELGGFNADTLGIRGPTDEAFSEIFPF
ncbi:MAG TPA: lasso RiPP family leader peptide-containing protein [Pseudonocardiaceae bacterium]|nr:lasso RiPP family leader peptide-containing protein [Pseudonocardiaceae bacterium]